MAKDNGNIGSGDLKRLRKNIIIEYILSGSVFAYLFFLMEPFADILAGEQRGIDGIGAALFAVFVARGVLYVSAAAFMIANPIRILVKFRGTLKYISENFRWRTACGTYIAIALPAAFVASVFMLMAVRMLM